MIAASAVRHQRKPSASSPIGRARCSGRLIPARADLDVLDLAPWLGRLSLYEALPDGDFRCRLRGSTMTTVPVPNHAASGILSLPSG